MRTSSNSGIEFVEAGRLGHLLLRLAKNCTSLDIAVAFLSQQGYQMLEPTLRGVLGRKLPVKMVVGLSSLLRITDKKAVEDLIDLSVETAPEGRKPLLRLKYYNNPGFHPKLFVFRQGANKVSVVIGSSNLTKGGQLYNTEANVLLVSPNSGFTSSVKDFWKRVWKNGDILRESKLKRYKGQKQSRFRQTSRKKGSLPITQLPPPSSEFDMKFRGRLPEVRKWWKISPGTQGNAWSEVWYPTIDDRGVGIIAIGWEEVGDLSRFREALQENNLAPLRQAIKETAKTEVWKTKRMPYRPTWKVPRAIDYETETLANYTGWRGEKGPLKVGDGVVAYSRRSVFGIGQIKGEYSYDESLPWQNHSREVQWFRVTQTPLKAPQRLVRALGIGKWPTITSITDQWVLRDVLRLPQWNSS